MKKLENVEDLKSLEKFVEVEDLRGLKIYEGVEDLGSLEKLGKCQKHWKNLELMKILEV